jgi:hypothetical protein
VGSWEITHAEFTTAGTPNGRVGPAAITPILVGLAFHAKENTTATSIVNLPVLFLGRPHYRSNRRWKYYVVASVTTAMKVSTVVSQSVGMFIVVYM